MFKEGIDTSHGYSIFFFLKIYFEKDFFRIGETGRWNCFSRRLNYRTHVYLSYIIRVVLLQYLIWYSIINNLIAVVFIKLASSEWLNFFFHRSMKFFFHFHVPCHERNYFKSSHFTKYQNIDGRHYYKFHRYTSCFANLSMQSTL